MRDRFDDLGDQLERLASHPVVLRIAEVSEGLGYEPLPLFCEQLVDNIEGVRRASLSFGPSNFAGKFKWPEVPGMRALFERAFDEDDMTKLDTQAAVVVLAYNMGMFHVLQLMDSVMDGYEVHDTASYWSLERLKAKEQLGYLPTLRELYTEYKSDRAAATFHGCRVQARVLLSLYRRYLC